MSEQVVVRILRLPAVMDRVGLRRARIYELESEGHFPKRVKVSNHAVGWIESEITAWLQARINASRA